MTDDTHDWPPDAPDRYVTGRMGPDEEAAFEIAFFEDGDLLDQVEAALAFKQHLPAAMRLGEALIP